LRVSEAQDLLCAGLDTAAIMRAGGWKSINTLGRYLEHAECDVWTYPTQDTPIVAEAIPAL
jgi:integrase/recombinase XerD